MLMDHTGEFLSGLSCASPGGHCGRRAKSATDRASVDVGLLTTLAIFAHDLRGPLASLSVLLEAIHAEGAAAPDGAIAARASKAQDIVSGLDALLSAMLARARAGGDPLAARPKWVDLGGLVERAAALSLPLAESRGVRLGLHVEELEVRVDEALLMQGLDNLVNNAVKHAPAGSTVAIEVDSHDGFAEVRIADRGPGFTEADLQRAFRPFTRLTAATEGPRSSFGLGLWIARLVAERHGGSVSGANREGGLGAVFTLRLPLDSE